MLLVATGRAANIEDIGLETTKVETDRGIVKVDGHMRTREPHVYAIGDIVGGLWLAHTAGHEGIIAAHTIAGDAGRPRDGLRRAAARDVLPAGDRLDRPDRAAVRGARPRRTRSARSRSRRSPRRSSAASTRASPRSSRDTETDDTLGVHIDRAARDRPHRRGVARVHARRDAVGDRRARRTPHPTLSEVIGEAAHGGRRPVDQLLGGSQPQRRPIAR